MSDREHQLELACRLADVLIGIEPERVRRDALDLIEDSELPTAVLDVANRTPRVLNAAWRALFGPRDAYTAIAGVEEACRTGATTHFAELALELGGRPAYGAAMLRPSCDDHGATTRVTVVCVDITDEVVARQLAADAATLVWSGRLGDDSDYFNHRWSAYAGDHPAWQHAIHPGDVARCNTGFRWAVRERGSTDIEARVRRADGECRWHRVRFEIASSGSRWFGTAIDIHDARSAEAERNEWLARERAARADAETANRVKDQFLSAVSHELRAPITTMMLWEGILRDEGADPALRAKALDTICQSAAAQSRLVGDLLDLARAIAGKLQVDLRPLEVERVVRGALDAVAPTARAKQIALVRRGAVSSVQVQADAVRLHQVLATVLSTAVEFTDPGGQVTIAVSRRGRSVAIEVEGGRGIDAELLRRMFEPSTQLYDSSMHGAGGLAVGLAVARQLVELHHGTIAASSAGPGRGTAFVIALAAAAARRTATPARDSASALRLDRTRVLVIDDDPRVREALALLLDRAGAVVDTADSAEMARSRIAHCAPEALVCDIAMPIEDGYSFIRGMRAAGSELAAIALTAFATESDVERSLAAGFDRHLAKPIDLERLVASIDELVVARRASLGH
ncbi:MAG TPA: response regulator [Kofleriaceae bacterium]|nr:response regulator [Kofleriaceae bacterium]